ncbi:hypothetical protein [Plantibacter sp. MPB07]|uniref:hypothetical protein n=1 Tax=Plantibacter sp. MPB07 TaxID=3388853 RepID=UPI0039884A1F
MWITFWPDILVAAVGAALAVFAAYATYLLNARRIETQALNNLIEELHLRRALDPSVEPYVVPNAAERQDFDQVSRSVVSIRRELRTAREAVRSSRDIRLTLVEMSKGCNLYLERAEQSPDSYLLSLVKLQRQLEGGVRTITILRPGVDYLAPGTGALDLD